MQATLVSAALIGSTLLGAELYLDKWRNTVRILARHDRNLAELGENLSERINRSLALNRQLSALHVACAAAVPAPAALATLQAEGQRVLLQQSYEQARIQALLLPWHAQAWLAWDEPLRDPLGPCSLPGLLRWSAAPLPRLQLRDVGQGAGIRIEIALRAQWRYADARVVAL